jgi:FkbM family methyltransferase
MTATVIRFIDYLVGRSTGRISYAQSGEDLIIDFIFRALRIKRPSYLDIGAHDPYLFSNSYFFYQQGSKGVTVEPDPDLYRRLLRERPRETHLNVGVAATPAAQRAFFVMSTPTLNTFSESEARRYEETGHHKIKRIDAVNVVTVEKIVEDNFGGEAPELLSVDVEGLDFEILASVNFNKIRPIVICVETLTFSESRGEVKLENIRQLLIQNDYMVYADTYINTIFVDRNKWKNSV